MSRAVPDLPPGLPILRAADLRGRTGGEGTRAVHLPVLAPPVQRPVGLPTYRSSTYAFDGGSTEYADVLANRTPGYSYARIDNPTADAFALAVASLEGAGIDGDVAAQPFASGMAAISTVLMTLCSAGSHVVVPAAVYGGTVGVLGHVLSRFGVAVTAVDGTDPGAIAAAIRDDTAVVWAETIANPTTAVADLPAIAAICRDAGVVFVVDSTFASPAVCRPLRYGVDLVVHSATKSLGGHSDATGGVVVGDPGLLARVRETRIDLGGSLAPDDAYLLHRGLATLPLRAEQACTSAATVAAALVGHPAVEAVAHPSLAAHPQHDLATTLFEVGEHGVRYGSVLSITPHGGRAAGMALADGLRLGLVATSLGGHHTLAGHAASTTHRQLDDAALAAAEIGAGQVRLSIGLEDAVDLVSDLTAALDRLLHG